MPWAIRMLLKFSPWILIIQIYLGWRFFRSINQIHPSGAFWQKLAVTAAVLFLNLLPAYILLFYNAGGQSDLFLLGTERHWLDVAMLYPYWWAFIVTLEILPYNLLLDLLRLTRRFWAGSSADIWQKNLAWINIILVVFMGMYVGWRVYRDTTQVCLDNISVPVTGLPPAASGLKIALLGDVHVDRYTGEPILTQIHDRISETSPDLILFSGDLVSSGKTFLAQGIQSLCGLLAPVGRIACMGDHDWWSGAAEIRDGLRGCGWDFLEDAHHLMEVGEIRILVTGITQIYSRTISSHRLNGILETGPAAEVKILLVHQPAPWVIEAAIRHKYDLVVAGHNHGGQVVFHPLGIPVTGSQLENSHFRDIQFHEGMPVVITRGVGMTLAPVRYGSPAEVTLITLQGG